MSFEEDIAHGKGSGLPSNAQPDYQNRSGGKENKYVFLLHSGEVAML
jgi:hypothetical protein